MAATVARWHDYKAATHAPHGAIDPIGGRSARTSSTDAAAGIGDAAAMPDMIQEPLCASRTMLRIGQILHGLPGHVVDACH